MSEITIVPCVNTQNSQEDKDIPACVSSIQTGTGWSRGYKVKRVLQHHSYDYRPKPRGCGYAQVGRSNHQSALFFRALGVTLLSLALVLLILWFVASLRSGEAQVD